MKVLLDTNILIDYIANREPFVEDAEKIIKLCRDRKIEGCIAAHSMMNIFYILRKSMTIPERKEFLLCLSQITTIIDIDQKKIINAINNDDFSDFEDCLQAECAIASQSDWIITRNVKDFDNSQIKPIEPSEFLKIVYRSRNG